MSNIELIRMTAQTLPQFEPLLNAFMINELWNSPDVFGIGAVKKKSACGVLICEYREDVKIRYLAVSPSFRRQGIGTAMIKELVRRLKEEPAMFTAEFSIEDETDPLFLFFNSLQNFKGEKTGSGFGFIDRKTLEENRIFKELQDKLKRFARQELSFYALDEKKQKECIQDMIKKDCYQLLRFDTKRKEISHELSLIHENDGRVNSCIFFESYEEKNLILSFMYCGTGGEKNLFLQLMQARNFILENMPQVERLYFIPVSTEAENMITKMIPQIQMITNVYHFEWDMM